MTSNSIHTVSLSLSPLLSLLPVCSCSVFVISIIFYTSIIPQKSSSGPSHWCHFTFDLCMHSTSETIFLSLFTLPVCLVYFLPPLTQADTIFNNLRKHTKLFQTFESKGHEGNKKMYFEEMFAERFVACFHFLHFFFYVHSLRFTASRYPGDGRKLNDINKTAIPFELNSKLWLNHLEYRDGCGLFGKVTVGYVFGYVTSNSQSFWQICIGVLTH